MGAKKPSVKKKSTKKPKMAKISKKKLKELKTTKDSIDPPKRIIQILGKDQKTGEVNLVFNTIEEAEAAKFNKKAVRKAIKSKTKYKGHFWEYSK